MTTDYGHEGELSPHGTSVDKLKELIEQDLRIVESDEMIIKNRKKGAIRDELHAKVAQAKPQRTKGHRPTTTSIPTEDKDLSLWR